MTKLVCVVGDKGGIGKSTWARGFADYCRTRQARVALFDGDWISRSLFKMFCSKLRDGSVLPLMQQDPRSGCILYDIHNRNLGRDLLLNSMAVPGVDIVLHDLPAGFRADFCHVMAINRPDEAIVQFVQSAKDVGIAPVFVTPLAPQWAGHHTAAWLCELLRGMAPVVAVCNLQYDEEQFELWRAGDRKRFLDAGGIEIAMPGLDPITYLNVDTQAVRFGAVANHDMLSVADKLRVGAWVRRFAASIEGVADVLGVTPPTGAPRVQAAASVHST
ncbi:MAG TPA: hypothetical protein VGE72_31780 [Azospirillum sp.]